MRKLTLALTAATAALVFLPQTASAAEDQPEASPTGKGIVGTALLGAEVVMLTEAALNVKPWWAYAVGGLAGGVAGGVGGYYIEQASGNAKVPMYLLTGGMALIIPTTVAVLSASAYDPPANYTEDRGPVDEPVAEPPQPSGAAPAPTGQRKAPKARRVARAPLEMHHPVAPPALVGMGEGSLTLSVPAVEVRQTYTQQELLQYGVEQKTELRVPVFNFVF